MTTTWVYILAAVVGIVVGTVAHRAWYRRTSRRCDVLRLIVNHGPIEGRVLRALVRIDYVFLGLMEEEDLVYGVKFPDGRRRYMIRPEGADYLLAAEKRTSHP